MSLNMKLVIWEIHDREQFGVTAVFADDAYGDDQLVMSFQPDLESALEYVKHMCIQGYTVRLEFDKDSSNSTKAKEYIKIFKDFEAYVDSVKNSKTSRRGQE